MKHKQAHVRLLNSTRMGRRGSRQHHSGEVLQVAMVEYRSLHQLMTIRLLWQFAYAISIHAWLCYSYYDVLMTFITANV